MGEGFDIGFQTGSALANGIAQWKQIQLKKQQQREFEGATALYNQRTSAARQALNPQDDELLGQYEAMAKRYPQAQMIQRPTGGVNDDGQAESEPVYRTPEGDISVNQVNQLRARKAQNKDQLLLSDIDALMEMQARYPDNPLVKQFVASTYQGIQARQQVEFKQLQQRLLIQERLQAQQRLQQDQERIGLERDKFDQQKREFDAAPVREQEKERFQTEEGIRQDAARIQAQKTADIEVEGVRAQNRPPKEATEAQGKAANFGRRAEQAIGELASIESYDRAAISSGLSSKLPNFMQPEERQRINQAERNFVNAMLRRDSGAVIKDEEFQNYEEQFFPRAGDKPGNVAQKKRNRELAVQALRGEAGFAWDLVPEGKTASAITESNEGWTAEGIREAYRAKRLTKDQALEMLGKLDAAQ